MRLERKQQNYVKQLSFNKKINKFLKNLKKINKQKKPFPWQAQIIADEFLFFTLLCAIISRSRGYFIARGDFFLTVMLTPFRV